MGSTNLFAYCAVVFGIMIILTVYSIYRLYAQQSAHWKFQDNEWNNCTYFVDFICSASKSWNYYVSVLHYIEIDKLVKTLNVDYLFEGMEIAKHKRKMLVCDCENTETHTWTERQPATGHWSANGHWIILCLFLVTVIDKMLEISL